MQSSIHNINSHDYKLKTKSNFVLIVPPPPLLNFYLFIYLCSWKRWWFLWETSRLIHMLRMRRYMQFFLSMPLTCTYFCFLIYSFPQNGYYKYPEDDDELLRWCKRPLRWNGKSSIFFLLNMPFFVFFEAIMIY